VKYAFIEAHRPMWRLKLMCTALGVSMSGYFTWRHRPPSPRASEDQSLTRHIADIHARNRGVYGSPRIFHELRNDGKRISRKRVERLMNEAGITAIPPRRPFVVTTDSNHDYPVADNILDQDFQASRPDERWVTDITYIPTDEGWLYLAAIMDLYSRRIVGWAMQDNLGTSIVLRALDMALVHRQPSKGLLHHSDRGSQYASTAYQRVLADGGITCSMSRRGNCYDNAAMESFFHSLKGELIHRQRFYTRDHARTAIFEYIEAFYNRTRRHSSIGYVSPMDFEQQHRKVA
jgi:putative transposase